MAARSPTTDRGRRMAEHWSRRRAAVRAERSGDRYREAEAAGQATLFPARPGDRLAPPPTGGWALAPLVTGRRP